MKTLLFLCVGLCLSSCDSFVSLAYTVENKTSKPLKVFVPNYQANGYGYSKGADTIIEIGPHTSRIVSATFPRTSGLIGPALRRIYKEYPGHCGLKLIRPDTTVEIACTKKQWKLRRGVSVLKIRH
jgi:hypothetical protein